ncbi:hypothetical protein V8C37DRAFT_415313 [Trichoderma ceciliae]
MADFLDSPVIRELAIILENIDPFPNPNDSDFGRCRGFEENNIGRCRIRQAQEQNQLDSLLSQFRSMTKCVDTKSLNDKMQTFITLTHCKRYHLKDALEAFGRWKTQRRAVISSPRPVTPSRRAASHINSSESISGTSNIGSPSFSSDSLEGDESALDPNIAEKMKGLEIATAAQDTPVQTVESDFDEIDAERERFKRLGDVKPPTDGAKHDEEIIYQKIRKCDKSMKAGLLYVLEHTKISGLFKIGWSRVSATQRWKQNCYGKETKLLYSTQGQTIIGAFQAEKIAHAILDHKRLLIVKCRLCEIKHKEWFLATEKEVLDVVNLAEQWLKMPAYALDQGKYTLTPEADILHQLMRPFSISKMKELMNKDKKLDNASGTSTGAVRETSASAGKAIPEILVDEIPDIAFSQGYKMRAKSPAARTGGKRDRPSVETNEIFEMLQKRSRETTPDGDGNHKTVTELEITRTIRTKVYILDLKQGSGVYNGLKPIAFDQNSKKQRGTEVKV